MASLIELLKVYEIPDDDPRADIPLDYRFFSDERGSPLTKREIEALQCAIDILTTRRDTGKQA
jgi:hypothetical protein